MIRIYTEKDLYEIAGVFYDYEISRTSNVYASLTPITGPKFAELPTTTQKQTVDGLKLRIDRETLPGYLNRKKAQVGTARIKPVEDELKDRGLL